MSSIRRTATCAFLLAALTAPAEARGLASINPRLKDGPELNLGQYVATPTASVVTVPKTFLDKSYFFGGMVEAATDNCLTLGTGADPIKVRFKVEGDRVLMLADQRDRVPDIGASSEDVINRFKMREVGDKVELDLANPEVNSVTVVLGASGYAAQRPGYIYDVVNEPGFLSYGEKYLIQNTGVDSELPARITLAIKYYLKECASASSYKPKAYTDEDFEKYGFFVTQRTVRKDDGTTDDKVLADRHDLSKKITYYLHPSIPAKFRPAFKDAILSWNKVFKKTHGIEPVEVLDGKDNQIPGDIRSKVLYWVDYPTPFGGGAIGPHTSDPDTGEILDADVIFYAGAFRDEIAGLRKEAEAAKNAPGDSELTSAIKEGLKKLLDLLPKKANRGFVLRMGSQTSMNFKPGCEYPIEEDNTIAARASVDVTEMTDDQAMERIIREVIPHEIGHTLGLRHNFKASADLKNLTDGAESTTVMEYQTSLSSLVEPGPYDYAAIAYGYEGDKSFYEGKEFMFGTDGTNAVDPLSNQFDSGDPLAYYTGRYAHFRKLLQSGLFSSLASYGRAQKRNMEVIRKFVNRGEQSKQAFDFLIKALTEKSEAPPFNVMERLQAMLVLTSDAPSSYARYGSRADYEALTDAQEAALAQALVANVVPDGKDIFEIRLAMMEALKARNNIYGYKGLEALANAYKKAMTPGADGAQSKPLPPREQELALRIQQAVGAYFNK